VGRSLARVGLFFGTLGLALGLVAVVLQIAPMLLLDGTGIAGLTTEQVEALVYAPLALRLRTFTLGMALFGVQMATAGYLIARSRYLPRWTGVLLGIGGTIYVACSLAVIIAPAFGPILVPVMIASAFIGETTLALWLLVKGVDRERWQATSLHA
jgi:hypothetical protein